MINKNRVLINALSSVLNNLCLGLTLFLIYKLIVEKLGIEYLGIWTVAMTTMAITNIANSGVQIGITRYIPIYLKTNREDKLGDLLGTTIYSLIVIYALITVGISIYSEEIYSLYLKGIALKKALEIFPYLILSLFINAISSILSSFIDGLQRSYLKLISTIISSLVFYILSYILITSSFLHAIAIAQLFQALSNLFILTCFLIYSYPNILKISWRLDRSILKETFMYSGNLQIVSILVLFYEPVSNFFINRYGGLAMLGFYEMSNKLVSQIRGIIIQANQALIPIIAQNSINSDNSILRIYNKLLNLVTELSFIIFSCFISLILIISYVWIGNANSVFIVSSLLLSLGCYFNILSLPAYLTNISIAKMKSILMSHFITVLLNVFFCYVLGTLLGGYGAIIAKVLAMVIASIYMYLAFNKENNIGLTISYNMGKYIIIYLILSVVCWISYYYADRYSYSWIVVSLLIICFFVNFTLFVKNNLYKFLVSLINKQ